MQTHDDVIRLFLCGDVMTGRGIDQLLPHPGDPRLYEPFVKSAVSYVELAERVNGPVPRPDGYDYVWGDALSELAHHAPHVRLINLETAVTTGADYWRGKGIHYRMHPSNVACLSCAGVDACALANNHVMDWGREGLAETLDTLRRAGIGTAGAGGDGAAAMRPARIRAGDRGRVLFYSFATESSGVPPEWSAGPGRPGVNLLPDLSDTTVGEIAREIARHREDGDVVVASIHWGGNWGYEIPGDHRAFAHGLIERAGVDVIHGHSSHHPLGMEVHHRRLILYGCGDLLNDYEGIGGYEFFRADLGLMYFAAVSAADGCLRSLRLTPVQVRRLRLNRTSSDDTNWLAAMLNREGARLGTAVVPEPDGRLTLVQD